MPTWTSKSLSDFVCVNLLKYVVGALYLDSITQSNQRCRPSTVDARYIQYPLLTSAANEAGQFLANFKADITTFVKDILAGQADN